MATPQTSLHKPYLGTVGVALICISAVLGLRNLPLMAGQGLAAIFYYVSAAVLFFIPVALVCAELGSGWPQAGGVYAWVREAFGERLGFFAIWLHWIEGVVCLPLFAFFSAYIAIYLINPGSIGFTNETFWMMQALIWTLTIVNYFSPKISDRFSELGTFFGTLLPSLIIIVLGIVWLLKGEPILLDSTPGSIIPQLNFNDLSFFSGVILSFAGVEVAAYHMREIVNPKRTYSKAIMLAIVVILTVFILGTLAVALVVPKEELLFAAGVLQALEKFFVYLGYAQFMPILAGSVFVGALAILNTWIMGPSIGLQISCAAGNTPFGRENRFGAPGAVLIVQAVLASLLSSVFMLLKTDNAANTSYWILTVIASQLFLILYTLVFLSAIRLRKIAPHVERPFRVGGGRTGFGLVVGVGLASTLFVFVVSFYPPPGVDIPAGINYPLFIALGIIFFAIPPWLQDGKKWICGS